MFLSPELPMSFVPGDSLMAFLMVFWALGLSGQMFCHSVLAHFIGGELSLVDR